ncbi:zinc metallopeptidase [Longirhabdus pacifica]|uniref:zinc metallopeptidase n=1 Tax=Longirhabdus pacifica TaxID=2305227 RepID=UPI001008D6F4|nr:zinc metallopeptidase [Longirhabdus pacifica]
MLGFLYLLGFIIFGVTIWAQFRVKGTFNKFTKVAASSGMTGYEAARKMLDTNGLYDVQIEPVRGTLTDHYDPIKKVVRLSEPVYNGRSISAISVACHEIGHAIQDSVSYPMLVLRHRMFPAVNFTSGIAPFLLLAGIFMNALNLVLVGVIFFAVTVLFQLVTLPVEFNASNRAREQMVSLGFIGNNEERGVAKVLNAAALTYVAAAAFAVVQLLQFVFMFLNNNE